LVRVGKDSPVELTLAVAVFSCFYSISRLHTANQVAVWNLVFICTIFWYSGGGHFFLLFLEPLVTTLVSTTKRMKWSLSKVNDPFDTFAALKNSVSIPSDSECILVEFVLPRTQFSR